MRDALLPAVLLQAAFGLALSSQGKGRPVVIACGLSLGLGLLLARLEPGLVSDAAFAAAAGVTIVCAVVAISSRALPDVVVLALAMVVGAAIGSLSASTVRPLLPLAAAPALGLVAAKRWRDVAIVRLGVRIAAGWLVAIALLSLAVPLVATPGYLREHAE